MRRNSGGERALGRAMKTAGWAMALALAGCVGGVSGGGGGGILYSGGAPDSPCSEASQGQGCVFADGTVQRVACQAGKWTALGSCTSTEFCAEEGLAAAKIATCKPKQAADVTSGGDGTTAGDGATAGDGLVNPDGAGQDIAGEGVVDTVGDASGSDGVVQDVMADSQDSQGTDVGPAECGNGKCEIGESTISCPQDCTTPKCGNGACEAGENATSCIKDCASVCPGGTGCKCVADSDCNIGVCHVSGSGNRTCPQECIDSCPTDWTCTEVNNAKLDYVSVCVSKAGYVCGDNKCNAKENPDNCSKDCKAPVCGNGTCEPGESSSSCVSDCPVKPYCGNGKCESASGEDSGSCPTDCPPAQPVCGDGKCNGTETPKSCISDCPGTCGDGYCVGSENAQTCAADCPSQCGDTYCTGTETNTTCPKDCPAATSCGDGKCAASENYQTCAKDCIKGTYGCKGMCGLGSKSSAGAACYCDTACVGAGDCCTDYKTYCSTTTCTPVCTNKNCGADGCGGTCGTCGSGYTCDTLGKCVATTVCGDGFCDSPETSTSCPADCKTTAHPCNTACGSKPAGYSCFCDTNCKGNGDCCTATGGLAKLCSGSTCASCNK